jgi:hypothetical protein
MPMVPTPDTPTLSWSALAALWECHVISWWRKKGVWAWLTDGSARHTVLPKRGQLLNYGPFLGHDWRAWRRTLLCGQNFEQCRVYLLWRKIAKVWVYTDPWHGQWFGTLVWDLEGAWLRNWWQDLGKAYSYTSLTRQRAWRHLCPMWILTDGWAPQRGVLIIG